MGNEAFQNALRKIPQKAPPIWMMRQAGRYHSHYQKLKEKYTFVQLCKEPELAAETALGPIDDFDFDVSILFSDLLFPLEAMGMGLTYNPGPQLHWKLNHQNLSDLKPMEEALEAMTFQKNAMLATRERLPSHKSLIGFVGGPWTLFSYAVEGSHKAPLKEAKSQLPLFEKFSQPLTELLIGNIHLQLEGGAEAVMVLDTAAGEISPHVFRHFALPPLERLAKAHPGKIMYYSKGTTPDHLQSLWDHRGWLGVGVDHRWDMAQLLKRRPRGAIQGNFDQTQLFSDQRLFRLEFDRYLKPIEDLTLEERAGWICGLGHGLLPQTPEKHVHYIVEHVRKRLTS